MATYDTSELGFGNPHEKSQSSSQGYTLGENGTETSILVDLSKLDFYEITLLLSILDWEKNP